MKLDSKYLGLPSFWGRSKSEAYTFIIEMSLNKMQGWKHKQMSFGGKEIMIKSEIQPISNYAMSCFLLPKGICDKLNSSVSNFWWEGDPEKRGIHWNSWEKMTQAKEVGGMGFKSYRAMNEALLAKQCWRLLKSPHSFWGRILKGLYFSNCSFMDAGRGSRACGVWMSLLHGRDTLNIGLRWQIENGDVKFWEDGWIPTLPNFRVSSLEPEGSGIYRVADVIDGDRRCWDEEKLGQAVSEEVVKAISVIPVSYF